MSEFGTDNSRKGRLDSWCKSCRKEYRDANKEQTAERTKRYRDANKEQISENGKRYRDANKERVAERNKRWRDANKERIAETGKRRRDANKERVAERNKRWYGANKERKAETNKHHYEANKERKAETGKRYRDANKERIAEIHKAWRVANPAKSNLYNTNRRRAVKQATPPWSESTDLLPAYELAQVIQAETGIPQHVDHFHPIKGYNYSGLHVKANLRVIPGPENSGKCNAYPQEHYHMFFHYKIIKGELVATGASPTDRAVGGAALLEELNAKVVMWYS